jgi:hypothetical protein
MKHPSKYQQKVCSCNPRHGKPKRCTAEHLLPRSKLTYGRTFCRFRNQSGVLYARGLDVMSIKFSMSSAEHSPARLAMFTSPFLHAKFEKRRPIPRILVMAYIILFLPSTLVFRTRKICVKWSGAINDPMLPAASYCGQPERDIHSRSSHTTFAINWHG